MDTERKWVIIRIDGKIAAISTDYGKLAEIATKTGSTMFQEITARTASTGEILELKDKVCWDDFMLFGTEFQKKVWHKLWSLTHGKKKLLSYSDFAEMCNNRAGVRAVAHAISLNPLPILIPCHLIVPKEAIDKIGDIRRKAESTIFKGDDLCLESILSDQSIDFGEYAPGRKLKRELIRLEFT